ncbi:CidA/LrgA family protein [Paracoccus sp. Z330]|uniref:CidA/LrgA family protein n=1 Tax=Paracoccus onchidii TaxID=3017813 RepID=A0ABT4ZEB0_9RHOB|nr:CidA/LrgA family protein [Paracoccus onchidii]MDB6177323.1 CidA/LrgA family protein [Paracoccus onchidii]
MLAPVAILFVFQLVGEVIARSFSLPVPGPVIGLALLALTFTARPAVKQRVEPVSRVILSHLSLLFVPAGVGVIASIDTLSENWGALTLVLLVSTVIALAATVATFLLVLRWTGNGHE